MRAVRGEAHLRGLERAVRDALPTWSLSPTTDVVRLNVSENVTFTLNDRQNNRRLVLRVHRPGYHSEAEIQSELAWITALREQGAVTTPAPVSGANGKLIQRLHAVTERHGSIAEAMYHAVIFEHVAGHEPARTEDLFDTFRALGAITARMHMHARIWARPAGFVRKTWNFRTMLGDRALWGDWRAGPGLHRTGSALLERAAECLRVRLARFGMQPARFGLIHADLRLTNLLAYGETLNVIDFDDCGFGWFAYDFAASVSFIEDDPAVPGLLAAWLQGYRTVAPFSREDETEIPTFIMLRRLLLLAWMASHAEAQEAQALGSAYTAGTLALADDFLRRYT